MIRVFFGPKFAENIGKDKSGSSKLFNRQNFNKDAFLSFCKHAGILPVVQVLDAKGVCIIILASGC